MTFFAPGYLWLGLAALLGVTLLHFLAWRRPRPRVLPTARFVPDRPARAASLARRPSDMILLLLRAVAVACVGLALARPDFSTGRRPVVRVLVLDTAGADSSAVSDSAGVWARDGDAVLSCAGLSCGLVMAQRAAAGLRSRADSFELVLVSPFTLATWDAATAPLRAQWRGRATLVTVPARTAANTAVEVVADEDDPVRASLALAGVLGARGQVPVVRVVRREPSDGDSAFARAGGAVVVWAEGDGGEAGEEGEEREEGRGAVVAGGAVVVAPFRRGASPEGTPVAWWVDGSIAGAQQPLGAGCIRRVAVRVEPAGDVALRTSMQRFAAAMAAPCAGAASRAPLSDSTMALLRGDGPLRARADLTAPVAAASLPAGALILLALLLLGIEALVRRRPEIA